MQIASLRDEAVRGVDGSYVGGRRVPTSRAFSRGRGLVERVLGPRLVARTFSRSASVQKRLGGLAPSRWRKPSCWRPELGRLRRADRPSAGRLVAVLADDGCGGGVGGEAPRQAFAGEGLSWDSEYGALAAVMDLGRFARLVVVGVSSSEGGAADLLAVT